MKRIELIKLIVFLIALCSLSSIYSQEISPEMLGFTQYKFKNEGLGEVNYYLSKSDSSKSKPLLIYLDGSGPYPLFQKLERGIGSTVVIDFQKLSKDYRLLLISKPGVPFIDEVSKNENGFPIYDPPQEYVNRLSLDWRVDSANVIINYILQNKLVETDTVIAMGFSEGAQVVPKLAAINSNIDVIMLFSGNGLTQFYDPLLSARLNAAKGNLSETEAQHQIDSLFIKYNEILQDPKNTKKEWYGHTYKRWASFASNEPLKYLLQLDIPIYLANGSLDENPISSTDYIKLEFIRNNKANLTYKTYPNYNHQFNEMTMENGTVKDVQPKINNVIAEAFKWLQNQISN